MKFPQRQMDLFQEVPPATPLTPEQRSKLLLLLGALFKEVTIAATATREDSNDGEDHA